MQLPILSTSPTTAAKESPDAWVRKLSVEAAQLVATSYTHQQLAHAPKTTKGTIRSNKSHPHHPITKWVNRSLSNWFWALEYGIACIEESMFHRGLQKSAHHLAFLEWCLLNPPTLPDVGLTDFVMMKGYSSYSAYFNTNKQHLAKWTNRETPEWYKSNIA